ncbi:hypothetical protein SAMD00023520_02155 [Listeria monocytogenes]|nr:hypothetical protein SAMD00023520_02155 [Listeria monocytogenes]
MHIFLYSFKTSFCLSTPFEHHRPFFFFYNFETSFHEKPNACFIFPSNFIQHNYSTAISLKKIQE